ncbi:hypothetical protein BASA61_004095 [Batrachochytrium salamandrivorans]|nr:hypothetical protein BASA61_004095 [Batrachochytrium salamandrivorans]KAH9273244.1 hypothetical protein BASA83_004533 [Batrachochytrium salamandrivorans]
MKNPQQQRQQLYKELEKLTVGGDLDSSELELVVKLCNKLLSISPSDVDAVRTKSVALVKLGRYGDAATSLTAYHPTTNSSTSTSIVELQFEKAYCLYRTNSLDESLHLVQKMLEISAIKSTPLYTRLLQLKAQVLYRLELFDECIHSVYKPLLKAGGTSDSTHLDCNDSGTVNESSRTEILTNMLAAKAAMAMCGTSSSGDDEYMDMRIEETTYEMMYNSACKAIGDLAYTKAEKLLKQAQKTCRTTMLADGFSEEEIQQEMMVIFAQIAYIYQQQGQYKLASEQYHMIIKNKAADQVVQAISHNNLMAIRGSHHELFESAKTHKMALSDENLPKLNSGQRQAVEINSALLLIYLGKTAQASKQLGILDEKYQNSERIQLALISMGTLQKKSKSTASVALLREKLETLASQYPDSVAVHLTLVQAYLDQSVYDQAIAHLERMMAQETFGRYRPGLISVLTWAYSKIGNPGAALEVLEKASQSNPSKDMALLAQLAMFKLSLKQYEEASKDYLALIKLDSLDLRSIAGLVISYSHFNPQLAEEYADHLPAPAASSLNNAMEGVSLDVDSLEAAVLRRKAKQQLLLHISGSAGVRRVGDGKVEKLDRPKNKRKRKPVLLKCTDPATKLDPERWIPKRFRSSNIKKGKTKRDALRGSQGVNIEGGGIGGTGSARIAGISKMPATATPPLAVSEESKETLPAASLTSPASSKKKVNKNKKKGK